MRGRGGGIYNNSMRGVGSSGIGPGRRVLKLGVGGFTIRNSKSGGGINNRSYSFGGSSSGFSPQLEEENNSPLVLQNDDDKSNTLNNGATTIVGISGKPRMRRPRKSRKPQLEDAYPPNIQVYYFFK
jgi:hypothetical protein